MVTPSEQMFSAFIPLGEVLLFPMGVGGGHCAQSPTLSHPQEASYLGGASMSSECSLQTSASE